jgi:translation initiation factor IF-1
MGKSYKKAARAAKSKNEELNKAVLTEENVLFGRAMKTLGNGRFRIQTTDNGGHGVEVDAAIAGKTVVRIQLGDVVVIGRNESSKNITYEILGSCDKKAVKLLRDAKRLHPSLFSEDDTLGDDLFDRSEDVAAEEDKDVKKEKGNKPVKKDKMTVDDDDEVNVDAI